MKKVIIASKNPVKIKAVKNGFKKMFPKEKFDFVGVPVPSGVPNQPIGNKVTLTGAVTRVNNTFRKITNSDYYVGIEGGLESIGQEMEAFAWIVIKSKQQSGKARTGTFFLPKEVVRLIKKGKELGEADDIVFKRKNSKLQNGAVGILTGDIIKRVKLYSDAVILALIPFKNTNLY